ncbi:MAG TPA: cation-transporting P-type ATPase [Candidatus Obscuribacterales bacterium]
MPASGTSSIVDSEVVGPLPSYDNRPLATGSAAEVYATLGSCPDGLLHSEAAERLKRFGANTLAKSQGKSWLVKFASNFTHLMAILLWAAGLVGFLAHMPQLGVAIWLVNIVNGSFSFWQEYRAEKAAEALKQLLPARVTVRRQGELRSVPAEELVPGDVMLLEEGDRVSADARIVKAVELRVNQSVLTGESAPVEKDARPALYGSRPGPQSHNVVLAGTTVECGHGEAVVFATGMKTEFGKIASLTQSVIEEPSPLQKEMGRVTRIITALSTGIGIAFFLLAVLVAQVDPGHGFVFALGMIVAFVPEGMVPAVTLSLAMGVQRMARRNALVKRLSAVETLGCTSVILTDKTGTLTKNEMTVRELWVARRKLTVTGVGYAPEGAILSQDAHGHAPVDLTTDSDLCEVLIACVLCNNARFSPTNPGASQWRVLGDPTEGALRVLARKGRLDEDLISQAFPRLRELPFSPDRKRMTTVHQRRDTRVAFVKGAVRETLLLCNRIRLGGNEVVLSEQMRQEILTANDEFAKSGLRVLAVAERELPAWLAGWLPENIECDLVFLGLVGMMDPPHPEVAEAVEKCQAAGIRVVMITGDYGLTAESIARRVGIVRAARARIMTGDELDSLDDSRLQAALSEEIIFARTTPAQKLRIVTAFQKAGYIVAVTGDGVNDAPALRKADIGVAMGGIGTDVAKESADMILLDDNFASIVNAVEEGRTVYANIRRFAIYVFNSNMAEAVPFVALLFSRGAIPLPLTLMQVLSVDLGTDMVPAIALGAEPPEPGVMQRPPRSLKEPLLNWPVLARALLWYGAIESIAAMSSYFYLNWQNGWPTIPLAAEGSVAYRMATTMTLAGIVATQVGAVLCCRSDHASIFSLGLLTNRLVLLGIFVEVSLLGLLIYAPPLQSIFNTAPLAASDLAFAFAWAPAIVVCDELRKWCIRRRNGRLARS